MTTQLHERACMAYACACKAIDENAGPFVVCRYSTFWGGTDRCCTRRAEHLGDHYSCGRVSWRDGDALPQMIDVSPEVIGDFPTKEEFGGVEVVRESAVVSEALDDPAARRALRELALKTWTILAPCGCKVRVPVNHFAEETRHRQCEHGVWRVVLRSGSPLSWLATRRAARDGTRMDSPALQRRRLAIGAKP